MVKKTFPEAMARIYFRMFVCKVCKTKIRADSQKVKVNAIKCRKCKGSDLRQKKKPQ